MADGCFLCPRRCGRARTADDPGLCGADGPLRIARAALHSFEEPCISGKGEEKGGAGAIFFVGCSLGCVYCQNGEISRGKNRGAPVSKEEFQALCFSLKEQGAFTIDLVTPSHYAPQLREALLPIRKQLGIPIVCNTGGYDSPRQLELLGEVVDIYLPDYKYADAALATELSFAGDYPSVAEAALLQMLARTGPPEFDERGLLRRGVLVRHLVLPGKRRESIAALRRLRRLVSPEAIRLSLLRQYTPPPEMAPPLDRTVTSFEYESVLDEAVRLGFFGYSQSRTSVGTKYIPSFDLTGVREAPPKKPAKGETYGTNQQNSVLP